MPMTGSVPHTN